MSALTDKTVDELKKNRDIPNELLKQLIETDKFDSLLFKNADEVRRNIYGNKVYIRGLIEISSYCKNNCYYCGIRRGNNNAQRYRLSEQQILSCCEEGYRLGFRTFVLQGGEDPYFTDETVCNIICKIKNKFPDCALTLSLGEKSRESYLAFFNSGADRYLLRHETADNNHYSALHPEEMSLEHRKRCLFDLKEIGYQVGSGFMVGAPYQTTDNLISDLRFLMQLQPDMIGIGPFIKHNDTPFNKMKNGSLDLTVRLIAILRLMFPYALIPSTTALGTISPNGREKGLQAGANVVMPNLSPSEVRDKYSLYENKLSTGAEGAQSKDLLCEIIRCAGYEAAYVRGDVRKPPKNLY